MNLNKLLESIEIFKKYIPETEQENDDELFFPFDLDYMCVSMFLRNKLVEVGDCDRLMELGWGCNKSRSNTVEYRDKYSIAENEAGNYEFYFNTRR